MKNFLLPAVLAFGIVSSSMAFECKAFIPTEKGVEYVSTFYNKKGKITTVMKRTLTNIEDKGEQTNFTIHQVTTNKKGKKPFENDYTYKCQGGIFYVDMKLFLNQPAMKAYRDMEMVVDAEDLEMPTEGTAGQTLKNGTVTAKVGMTVPINITIDISNRKVGGEEKVTTSAGTFTCIKIMEDVNMKIAFAKVAYHLVTWYAENNGIVKQETYDIDNKTERTSYSLLTEIKK